MRVVRDERGLGWFTAAGFLFFIVALAVAGSTAKLSVRADAGASPYLGSPTTAIAGLQDDLRHAARLAVYEAIWQVGWRASEFGDDASRVLELERLASKRLRELVCSLESGERGAAELQLGSGEPAVKVQKAGGGFVLARVDLPKGTRITASAPDNSAALTLACENLEVFVDSRYFLLQERMNAFVGGLGDVHSAWQWAEYAAAWVQVPSGRVRVSGRISRELFKLAWARHEYQSFGSFDYLEALDLGWAVDPSLNDILRGARSELQKVKTRIEFERENLENLGVEPSLLDNALGAIENGLHRLPSTLVGREILDLFPKDVDPVLDTGRAHAYTIAPPRPINPQPGLSVLRELEIERVTYRRRDPAGWFGTLATPIYIPFINVTIWFAELEVSIELKRKPIEQIYDFDHLTLPRPLLENGVGFVNVHKALTYRYELPLERVSFSLYLVWPWVFSVEVG